MYVWFILRLPALGHVLGYSTSCSSIKVPILAQLWKHIRNSLFGSLGFWIASNLSHLKQYTECWGNDIPQNRTHVELYWQHILFLISGMCFNVIAAVHYWLYLSFTLQWSHLQSVASKRKTGKPIAGKCPGLFQWPCFTDDPAQKRSFCSHSWHQIKQEYTTLYMEISLI